MSLLEPPKKRKKLSKNKKRNWAKTDIADVEEHLEAERIQLRTGGLAEEKSDDQLFFVDKKETSENTEKAPKPKRKQPKTLKSHALLNQDNGVKPVIVSQAVPDSNKQKKKQRSEVSKSEVASLEQRRMTREDRRKQMQQNAKRINNSKDLWAEDDAPKTDIDELVKKQRVKVPACMKRSQPSVLPAVEVAHPGQSYNPSLDDHQDLLSKAVDVELKKEKERLKMKRALDDAFPSAADAPTEATYIQEMSAGLFEAPDDEAEEEGDIASNPPVRRESKKTERQRKKEAARKKKEEDRLNAKTEKLRKQNLFRIKSIKKEVKAREVELDERERLREEKRDADKSKTKKLSQYQYEDPSIPVKLSHELEQSLRLLKPEGSLVLDRFKSLQKRNIIETRKRQTMKRKYKHKTFEKKSHKAVDV